MNLLKGLLCASISLFGFADVVYPPAGVDGPEIVYRSGDELVTKDCEHNGEPRNQNCRGEIIRRTSYETFRREFARRRHDVGYPWADANALSQITAEMERLHRRISETERNSTRQQLEAQRALLVPIREKLIQVRDELRILEEDRVVPAQDVNIELSFWIRSAFMRTGQESQNSRTPGVWWGYSPHRIDQVTCANRARACPAPWRVAREVNHHNIYATATIYRLNGGGFFLEDCNIPAWGGRGRFYHMEEIRSIHAFMAGASSPDDIAHVLCTRP